LLIIPWAPAAQKLRHSEPFTHLPRCFVNTLKISCYAMLLIPLLKWVKKCNRPRRYTICRKLPRLTATRDCEPDGARTPPETNTTRRRIRDVPAADDKGMKEIVMSLEPRLIDTNLS